MKTTFEGEDWAHHHVMQFLEERISGEAVVVTPETQMGALGLDSLDIVELIMHLEDELGISLSAENTSRLQTVGDLIQVVREARG